MGDSLPATNLQPVTVKNRFNPLSCIDSPAVKGVYTSDFSRDRTPRRVTASIGIPKGVKSQRKIRSSENPLHGNSKAHSNSRHAYPIDNAKSNQQDNAGV